MSETSPKVVAEQQGIHDAVRHSTAQTPVREAREAWEKALAEYEAALRYSLVAYGPELTDDPKVLRPLALHLRRVAGSMARALEAVHWPEFDPARTLKTDERGHELAARMLREHPDRPELAWGLLLNAFRLACDHSERLWNGIDLSVYYRCEANAIAEVLRRHYHQPEGVTDG
jgi:hypothetical protein